MAIPKRRSICNLSDKRDGYRGGTTYRKTVLLIRSGENGLTVEVLSVVLHMIH